MARPRLLFVSHRLPYPPNKGDKIRSYHILRHLARRYDIHLASFIDDPDDRVHLRALEPLCVAQRIEVTDRRRFAARAGGALLRGRPLSVAALGSAAMRRWITGELARHRFDWVYAYSSASAALVPPLDGPRLLVDFVDVDSEKWAALAAHHRGPRGWVYRREAERLLAFDRAQAARARWSVFVSPAEAAVFRELVPQAAAHTVAVGNAVDLEALDPSREYENPYTPDGKVLVFAGAMDYAPNVDAVRWFAHEVWPAIRRERADARFVIVGARPGAGVRALGGVPGVQVTGAVPDVRPYLAHAHAAVASLRIARGIQNKVLEALAMGLPVIATPAAMEGLEFAADSPARAFVAADAQGLSVVALRALGAAPAPAELRAEVARRYTWDAQFAALDELLSEACET